MIDLCLVNTPLFRDKVSAFDEDSLPAIGLGYIATSVKRKGCSVVLIDAIAEQLSLNELQTKVLTLSPRTLALNIFTTNFEIVQELVESLDGKINQVIIGGLVTGSTYHKIFKWSYSSRLDIVFGDGELITADLVSGISNQVPTKVSGNMRYFVVNSASPYFIKDISSLKLDRSFFPNEPIDDPKWGNEAHLVAGRGCIYNCGFCGAARALNRSVPVRERSMESLKEEVAEIVSQFPSVTSIRILDDLFLKNAKSVENAVSLFTQSALRWRSMAHIMTFKSISGQQLVSMKESGCVELFIGIESGSPRVLRQINKAHNVDLVVSTLSRIFDSGISVKGYFIYGFPGETKDDFDLTLSLAERLHEIAVQKRASFRTSVFQFRPYHGTSLYNTIRASGLDIEQVSGDNKMTSLIGRRQFNFTSGNYSNEPGELIQEYVKKTSQLRCGQNE